MRHIGLHLTTDNKLYCYAVSHGEVVRFPVSAIRYMQKDLREIHICLGAKQVTVYAKFDEIEPQLPASFCRCHESFLVNLDYVTKFRSNAFYMETGEEIPISATRRADARGQFLSYSHILEK